MSSSVSEVQNTVTVTETPQTKTPGNKIPTEASGPSSDSRIPEEQGPEFSDQSKVSDNGEDGEGEGGEGEEEEEGECGFCLFMKGGGCRESFIAWEQCVEDAEKNKEDVVEKCFEVTGLLKKCMEQHADYYEPILRAEKAAEEEAVKELEREKASRESEQRDASIDGGVEAASRGSEQQGASID